MAGSWTIFNSMRRKLRIFILAAVVYAPCVSLAQDTAYAFGGHVKPRLRGQTFADESIFRALTGSSALDLEADLRLNFEIDRGPWSFETAYQLFAGYGDRIEYSRSLQGDVLLSADRLPNDRRRLMNLTDIIRDKGKFAALHRLDRLWLRFSGEKTVVRIGRQAISWGNGFFFAPMDLVNPFDPAAIDTEYKPGDDMIYVQYLRDNGDDLQAAAVIRRDVVSGDVDADEGTITVKYHALTESAEFDLLLAKTYDRPTAGLGANRSIGGAVWRGDVVITDVRSGVKAQVVTNINYSWTWADRNVSGVVEYYYNGFGQKAGHYDPPSLAQNPELLQRLARGETFSLGRHYLAGGLTIEMTPLWQMAPNAFINVADPSALLQLVTQYSLGDNAVLLGAINVPVGGNGTEYGGIESGIDDVYLSSGVGVFAQLAWYF